MTHAPVDPVELTTHLMAIDSTSGREAEVIEWIGRFLAWRGWTIQRIPVTPDREDILATVDGAKPTLTFSTHLDTVPPFIPPHRDGQLLMGRGACDAKGIAAAMVCAAERLRERGLPVALLFVVGEEVTHDGAHAANEFARQSGIQNQILINGEPTESTLAVGTKGAVRVIVRTAGRAAHSAYPELGESATATLVRLLAGLDDLVFPTDDVLGKTTVNIGALAGGVADNVVAPSAEARLMVRLVSPVSEVRPILEHWSAGKALLEWGPMAPAIRLHTLPGWPTSVAAFATDIPSLDAWGTPYLFGPGSIHRAHRDDECVDTVELVAAVDAYERLAMQALDTVISA